MPLTVTSTPLDGLLRVQPQLFGDSRGFFLELYNATAFGAAGLDAYTWVQDNLSRSVQGTLRGLHFQAPPHAQDKLVCCLQGRVKDVVVDIRPQSPTYGHVYTEVLDSDQMNMLLVPKGFAHGFSVLSESCLFFYKCSDYYHKDSEAGLAWDDPALNIDWAVSNPILSDKDKQNPVLAQLQSPF